RTALGEWESRDRAYEAALVRWRLAEALLSAGDRVEAGPELGAAHRWATERGARPLVAELTALARRGRVGLQEETPEAMRPSPAPSDRFGLTAREREVLQLVAEGLSNRQIAERLFISENTAGVHVSNIIGKLGATGRL